MDPPLPPDLSAVSKSAAAEGREVQNSGHSGTQIVVDLSSDDDERDFARICSLDGDFCGSLVGEVLGDGTGGLGFGLALESSSGSGNQGFGGGLGSGGGFVGGIQGGGRSSGLGSLDLFGNGQSFGGFANEDANDDLFTGFGLLPDTQGANVGSMFNFVGEAQGIDLNLNFGGSLFQETYSEFGLLEQNDSINPLQDFGGNVNLGFSLMPGIGSSTSTYQPYEPSGSAQNVDMDIDLLDQRGYQNAVLGPLDDGINVGGGGIDLIGAMSRDRTFPLEARNFVAGTSDVIMVDESSVEEVHEVINVVDDDEVNYLNDEELLEGNNLNVEVIPESSQMQQLQQRRDLNRQRAILYAPRYALPERSLQNNKNATTTAQAQQVDEELPGPFSTALQIVKQRNDPRKSKNKEANVLWRPSGIKDRLKLPPSLKDLSLMALSCYGENIVSLKEIPSNLKHTLITQICRGRKMNAHILGLYLNKWTTEIHLCDCSVIPEEEMQEALTRCNINLLKVVRLDLCGRCMPDHILKSTLATSPNSLPSLTTLSLKGAYCLTDDGLRALAFSAPLLKSLNLGQCSLITSRGIFFLAEKLNIVELYLDDCQNVDASSIIPALNKLQHLEVLSVARLPNVTNDFIGSLMLVCGSNMKELILTDCRDLTSHSARSIGSNCPRLCALDLQKVVQLDDSAMKYLANGCSSLKRLKLRNNSFSDETVAAYLEASGHSLVELSFNNVTQIGRETAISISRNCCSSLRYLDLSFCRQITDELLGLIVDSCSHLRILKLFGCTQISQTLVDAHLNSQVKIIGLKDQSLVQTEMPIFLESVVEC